MYEKGIEFNYRNFDKEPLQKDELSNIAEIAGITAKELINTKSKNFSKLKIKVDEISEQEALDLILENPKTMRRPILLVNNKAVIGFKEEEYSNIL